jgi:hypothetical protein
VGRYILKMPKRAASGMPAFNDAAIARLEKGGSFMPSTTTLQRVAKATVTSW